MLVRKVPAGVICRTERTVPQAAVRLRAPQSSPAWLCRSTLKGNGNIGDWDADAAPRASFRLEVACSDCGVGGILYEDNEQGKWVKATLCTSCNCQQYMQAATLQASADGTSGPAAHYVALKKALQAAIPNGVRNLQICTNSKHVHHLLTGGYHIRSSSMVDIHNSVQWHLKQLDSYKITLITRNANWSTAQAKDANFKTWHGWKVLNGDGYLEIRGHYSYD